MTRRPHSSRLLGGRRDQLADRALGIRGRHDVRDEERARRASSTACEGPDAECLTHDQRRAAVHQFEAALRLLDERCRVYQYVIKRRVDPFVAPPVPARCRTRGPRAPRRIPERADGTAVTTSTTSWWCSTRLPVPHGTGNRWRGCGDPRARAIREWLSYNATCRRARGRPRSCDRARCITRPTRFEVQLADCGSRRLAKAEAFASFGGS